MSKTIDVRFSVTITEWHKVELELPDGLNPETPEGHKAIERILYDEDLLGDETYDKCAGCETFVDTILTPGQRKGGHPYSGMHHSAD